jgi:DNA-binding transcriptional regulator YdaS (Cro superfamily)
MSLKSDESLTLEAEALAVKKAAACCSSHKSFAEKIGVHPSFISQCISGIRRLPPMKCIAAEDACGGRVTRYEFRPDVFGNQPDRRETA